MTKSFYDSDDEPLVATNAVEQDADTKAKTHSYNKKIRKIALIVVPLVVCLVAGGYFFFKVIKKPKTYDESAQTNTKAAEISTEGLANNYVALEPIIANLLSTDKTKPVYLRITIVLRVSSEQEIKLIQSKLPIITDNFQTFLTGFRAADFNGTGGILLLKEELTKRVNRISRPVVIKDVLFKEMIIN